jgi:methylenetetrahydrofolate reductase (NADPH)
MKLSEIFKNKSPAISFEIFPPRTTKAINDLEERLPKLISLNPDFITVTYGALGSNREQTLEITSQLKNHYKMETAHHLTCVGSTRDELTEILNQIQAHNIENIIALRGDPPKGASTFVQPRNGYLHANELIEHIRRHGEFGIGVAGYPETHTEASSSKMDLLNLKSKVDSGADVVITQLYYDNQHYYQFLARCRALGITQPIIPGLMPILSFEQIKRITTMCGATIPAFLLKAMEQAGDNVSKIQEIGISHTANQALDLLRNGVPGIHFYVLNQHFHIAEIMDRIKSSLPES